MPAATTGELVETTDRFFRLIDAGNYDALLPLMSKDTWARAVADAGNLTGFRDTGLELPDGTPITAGDAVHGSLIGHTIIDCEAGLWIGRVAYDPDRHVVGLLIVLPDHAELPF